VITKLREMVATALATPDDGPSVHRIKPDNVTDVPCFVVDRPTIMLDVQHQTVNVPVVVIGRRDGSTYAQDQLDAWTSWAMGALAGPDLAVLRVDPSTATIAESTYPAYTITVACGFTACRT